MINLFYVIRLRLMILIKFRILYCISRYLNKKSHKLREYIDIYASKCFSGLKYLNLSILKKFYNSEC